MTIRDELLRAGSAGAWLKAFLPGRVRINGRERLRICCGALLGILATGLLSAWMLGTSETFPLLVAPMGASAVLLFAVPSSPLAQPWSILGGNVVSAAIGVACASWIGEPFWAAAVSIALAIGGMLALRCLHPPGGAMALSAVLGGPAVHALGFSYVLMPVALNSLLLLLLALFFNNATGRRYPHALVPDQGNVHRTADTPPTRRLGFTHDDLEAVLKDYNQMLDIRPEDLEELLMRTEMHAFRRRLGEITCADIMSRDVVTVEFATSLEQAWELLRWHRVKALPVLDEGGRVIGIVTLTDFMMHLSSERFGSVGDRLRQLLRASGVTHTDQPEVVGQIMTREVRIVTADTHIAELVVLLSDKGKHHVPVVDEGGRLQGMLTQSDLIAALYHGNQAAAA